MKQAGTSATELAHWAEYLTPGSFFPEEVVKRLDAHDPVEALFKAPKSAYCFVLYDTEPPPDLGPKFTVKAVPQNRSARYYIGGELHNYDEVKELGHAVLAGNMTANKWDTVIHCRTGNWQPFMEDDLQLEDPAA